MTPEYNLAAALSRIKPEHSGQDGFDSEQDDG